MKNIHILPTDKPSRVYKHLGRELKHTVRYFEQKGLLCINQHIYITSDEEIKEGDWYLTFTNNEVMGQPRKCEDTNWNFSHCKKIILTTDQDLIKDGIQSIDDEFLEWFVKNPSCEEVKVADYGNVLFDDKIFHMYKIVIPKEEQKQHLIEIMRGDEELGLYDEPQETLEEVADNHANQFIDGREHYYGFIAGAKWQAERMYNEEEVLEILENHTEYLKTFIFQYIDKEDIEENETWFEQFKKK
jgi:hypothetical protein